ncbi:amidohydrolase family protein [Amycolatopsis sp. PS_44_ISF1]|uniref:amidohydrolase family protein n=1 Tax=Amycolatopsis sp. PS_44_ISF1 TaxID=2974917 RepID=UPI0028DDA9A7|nr:amidohydrolase family protein [Amycolatopsis sp. PS_44_ISF1]MDT8913812.1 amidohydrolase family protein [Amycolatopsis sp. PS_44_ISF1]
MRLIALEEAFSIPELTARHPGLTDLGPIPISREFGRHVAERLPDFTGLRLPEMDRHGVDVQVLSLTAPGLQAGLGAGEALAAARLANDYLAGVIAGHPDRFAGFAALPMQDPEAATAELRRAVEELGLRGALVNDHTDGRYLDHPAYERFWTTLEELDVPLYLHPGAPAAEPWKLVDGAAELIGPTFTWGAETGGHALRLLYSGVFDRHPRAHLILGHMGEYLPFMLSRLDSRYATLDPGRTLDRAPSEYVGSNILITISGVASPAALAGAVLAIGADAIMFAVDYPYEPTGPATAAFAAAPLSAADRHKIAHGNAERLLKLRP